MKQERLSNMNHIKNQYNIIFFLLTSTAFSRCALLEKHMPQQQTSVNGPNYTIQVTHPSSHGFHRIIPQGNPLLHPTPHASKQYRKFVLSNYCDAIKIVESPFIPPQDKLRAQQIINEYPQEHPWLQAVPLSMPVVQKQINKTPGHYLPYQEQFSVTQSRPQPLDISTSASTPQVPQNLLSERTVNEFFYLLRNYRYENPIVDQLILKKITDDPRLMQWPITTVDNGIMYYNNRIKELTLLHHAAQFGLPQLTKYLIKEKPELINASTEIGETPIFFSVMKKDSPRHVKCLEILLKHGADPNISSNMGSILTKALTTQNKLTIEFLIDQGVCFQENNQVALFFKYRNTHMKSYNFGPVTKKEISEISDFVINSLIKLGKLEFDMDSEKYFVLTPLVHLSPFILHGALRER